jgi:hypothetical protein
MNSYEYLLNYAGDYGTPRLEKTAGGLLKDIETALRRRRLMEAAQQAALKNAEPAARRYRAARDAVLRRLGMYGLGAALGGLALYGIGRHIKSRLEEPNPSSEDFIGEYASTPSTMYR